MEICIIMAFKTSIATVVRDTMLLIVLVIVKKVFLAVDLSMALGNISRYKVPGKN